MSAAPGAELLLPELSSALLRVFPPLDESGRRIALHMYRELARGAPVAPAGEALARLRSWPGVYFDERERVIGFWGLTIVPMPHRLRIGERRLYAWCAWDTLFLPELVGADIDVQSACKASARAVRLTVTPAGVERASPAGTVLSFLVPEAEAVNADVITSFCHHVHFFQSADAALPWLAERPKAFPLSLADAHELGRRINRARYGEPSGRWTPGRS
jgi:alkylmercury lyase